MIQMEADHQNAVAVALEAEGEQPGALLPVLQAIQEQFGYIPPAVVPEVAQALNLSRAEVHGVISFYHDLRTTPPGRHVVQVCMAEACQAMGGAALHAHVSARLGVESGETRADGAVTLLPVYCLGNCACAPSVMVDGQLYGRVGPERFDRLFTAADGAP